VDALTGQVTTRDASQSGIKQLMDAHADWCAADPHARQIYVVAVNWPVPYHAAVPSAHACPLAHPTVATGAALGAADSIVALADGGLVVQSD
jgi:hypothetical protein